MGCYPSKNSGTYDPGSGTASPGINHNETKNGNVISTAYKRTEENVDIVAAAGVDKTKQRDKSEVVAVDSCMQISLPSHPSGSNKNETRSPRQQLEDKTPSEKEKKKGEEDKKPISDKFLYLKHKYKDTEIQFNTLNNAAELMRKQQRAQLNSNKNMFSLDETKYTENRLKVAKLKQDKTRRLNRLCELASARLRHNNPAIADLSDQNRATKLAEKLSELYDNEWTDTFEAAKEKTKKDDKIIVESLRDILKFCYERCRDIALEQQRTCFCLLNLNVETDFKTAAPELKLRLKEFQKNISQESLPEVKKVIKNGAVQNLKENVVVKSLHSTEKNPYYSYIDMCTEITWYMQLQDPPLVFDFDGSSGEVSRFRPYTVSGQQLDYILWPVLLLNEGGPVVSKGVAQFRKNSDDRDKGQTNKSEKKENTDGNDLGLV